MSGGPSGGGGGTTAQARKRRLGVAVGGEMAVKRFVAFASGTRVEHVMMVSGVQKVVAGVRKRTRRTGGRAEARVQRQRGEHGEQRARREQRGSDTSDDDRQAADAQRQLRQRVEQRGEQRRARSRSGQREEREGERRGGNFGWGKLWMFGPSMGNGWFRVVSRRTTSSCEVACPHPLQ